MSVLRGKSRIYRVSALTGWIAGGSSVVMSGDMWGMGGLERMGRSLSLNGNV